MQGNFVGIKNNGRGNHHKKIDGRWEEHFYQKNKIICDFSLDLGPGYEENYLQNKNNWNKNPPQKEHSPVQSVVLSSILIREAHKIISTN